MKKWTRQVEKWLDQQLPLLLALVLLLFLRLPNFFEPYWYGDEGIYLTLGQAIRDGERLYTEIVDHKTPLIYYFASVPNQFYFRLLTVGWMIITTIAFYHLARRILRRQTTLNLATFLFVIFSSVPWFEGNIPNGELFVMGFILLGGWLFSSTRLGQLSLKKKKLPQSFWTNFQDLGKIFLSGCLFGLATLTKVPAVFDVAAFLTLMWFMLTNRWQWLTDGPKQRQRWWQLLKKLAIYLLVLCLGLVLPIAISIFYFATQGSGQDYLQFGLLYNFRYTASWGMPYQQAWLNFFFTLPGKVSLVAIVIALLTVFRKKLRPRFQFVGSWTILALMASSLSNRPYPHYFMQLVPPLILLITLVGEDALKNWRHNRTTLSLGALIVALFIGVWGSLGFPTYGTFNYYRQFYRLATHQISLDEYRQSFSAYMADNYQAAEIIKKSGVDEIFIWGTNPMLYALSQTQPTGRFTVSFHIKDLAYYEQTMAAVEAKEPLFIVVMKDETQPLPGLDSYLENYYLINDDFKHFWLWKRYQ